MCTGVVHILKNVKLFIVSMDNVTRANGAARARTETRGPVQHSSKRALNLYHDVLACGGE